MIVRITEAQRDALARSYQQALAARVAAAAGAPHLVQHFEGYVAEAVSVGVTTEKEIARLCLLLLDIDKSGKRPPVVRERLADPEVRDGLKVFQVDYAWQQAQGLAP